MARGRALRERGATRRADERSPEHPDRAGSARHLLWATSSDYTILGADIQGFVPNPLYLDSFNFYECPEGSVLTRTRMLERFAHVTTA